MGAITCAVAVLSLIESDGVFLIRFGLVRLGLLTYKVVKLAASVYGNCECERRALRNWVVVFDNALNYARLER